MRGLAQGRRWSVPSSYSFLENDIGDALGGIDLGQGTRGLRHLHAAGGIFGQITQQRGNAVCQVSSCFSNTAASRSTRYSALRVW